MGTMIFQVPKELSAEAVEALESASIAGGQEQMPFATQIMLDNGHLLAHRAMEESGQLLAPWDIPGHGRLMLRSATLMERLSPYHLAVELARGKLNQLRCQSADWLFGGLVLPDGLMDEIRQSTHAFGLALANQTLPDHGFDHAQQAIQTALTASEKLVQAYTQQVFQIRHSRHPRLESQFGCRLTRVPATEAEENAFLDSFNAATLSVPWSEIEPVEGQKDWSTLDALVQWGYEKGLQLAVGPLIDFSGFGLPDWLWSKQNDLSLLAGLLGEFIRQAAERYHQHVRQWHLTAGSNISGVLASGEEELLWLTLRLVEAARQVHPQLELVVGLAQPFGDYLAGPERSQSPFGFADTLLRTGLRLSSLELEVVMGVSPRGTYCRDQVEFSRLVDLYSYLGLPLLFTLGYPSATGEDARADGDLRIQSGHWREGFSPAAQADWARNFASLALCKPLSRGLQWTHFHDGLAHQYPHTGLIDAQGNIKPALECLTALRTEHLQ